MRRFFTIIILISFNSFFAQDIELMNKFEFRSHSLDTTLIPYRFFAPEIKDEEKVPLVIALHGAGERGSDNQMQIEFHKMGTVWVDSINQREHPCFVIAPQCPKENRWVDADWDSTMYDFKSTPISNELATVVDLIDSLIVQHPIDINRIYITGLSMGGFGSWYLLMHNPNRFAAALIFSGAADPKMACKIKDIPIWNFHGDLDKAVPVEGSRLMIEAISNCGEEILLISDPNNNSFWNSEDKVNRILSSNHIYTEYNEKGHVIWAESYDNWYVREWLFSKSLK